MLLSHAFSAALLAQRRQIYFKVFIWVVAVILLNSKETGLSADLRVVETKRGPASGASADKY